jgi:hypothetical protein
MKSRSDASATYHYAKSCAHNEAAAPAILESLEAAEHAAPRDFLANMGWVLTAFQNAFYQLLRFSMLPLWKKALSTL